MLRLAKAMLLVSLACGVTGIPSSFAQCSVGFIENRGQVDSQVLYHARGSGGDGLPDGGSDGAGS